MVTYPKKNIKINSNLYSNLKVYIPIAANIILRIVYTRRFSLTKSYVFYNTRNILIYSNATFRQRKSPCVSNDLYLDRGHVLSMNRILSFILDYKLFGHDSTSMEEK